MTLTLVQKKAIAIGAGVAVLAGGAFFVLRSDSPVAKSIRKVAGEDPTCPLTGAEPKNDKVIDRPAIAVKIENNPDARPLSGLEKAEIVYEELVEGGFTRFVAIYHCTDTGKAGPIRSSRVVDPAIVLPYTRILAAGRGNDIVQKVLDEAELVMVDETAAGDAMRREERPGISSEHTLYGDTVAIRKLGQKSFEDAPSELYEFGDLEGKAKPAKTVKVTFSGASDIEYRWMGGSYKRFEADGTPFTAESGDQIEVDNLLIEEHEIDLSKTITDSVGTPSTEISDVAGTGRAVLFRDGKAIRGKWRRESAEVPVEFVTKAGETMVFKPGTIWIELVPSQKGDVKGSFSYAKR